MAKLTAAGLKKKINALKVGERLRVEGLDEDIYHAAEGVGSSLLKAASHSLAHYKTAIEHTDEEERSASQQDRLNVGSATHTLVLEPELFDQKYAVKPAEIKKRVGEEWKKFLAANKGKTIMVTTGANTLKDAEDMANAVIDGVGHYFIDGQAEVSYFYRHTTGLILKGRMDYERGDAIIDLKTTIKDTPTAFNRCVKYDYDWQDALYRMVAGKKEMIFVGVAMKSPHSVFLTKQGMDVRLRAERRIEEILSELAFAIEFQEFPAYPVELIETSLNSSEKQEEPAAVQAA